MDIWLDDIDTIFRETNLDGVDLYQLNILKGTPLYEQAVQKINFKAASVQEQAEFFLAGNKMMRERYVRRDSIRHYSFGIRERGIYNSMTKYGGDCLHFGSGAGGGMGKYGVFNARELKDYYSLLDQNKKPIKMMILSSEESKMFSFMTGTLEQKRALNLNQAGKVIGRENLYELYLPLLGQWAAAGVIRIQRNGWIELTEAGEFWNVNVAQNLIDYYNWKKNENI